PKSLIINGLALFFLLSNLVESHATADKFRCSWRDNPATSMVVGWDQESGNDPVFYYGMTDFGANQSKYTLSRKPDRIQKAKGMTNCFVRLTGLQANTVYYFVIKDSEGVSKRMSFCTASDNPDDRLSIVAGGDSRNMHEARINANKMVAKLRPNFVLFGGDMTDHDADDEWEDWMDDWQNTIPADGRLTPIIVSRGNHEADNNTLINLFDIDAKGNYYALNFGGNLLRVYTLNSFMPPAGDQKNWLINDLEKNKSAIHRIAQYHLPMRPHTQAKEPNQEQTIHWSPIFAKYGLKLAVECDAHVIKYTYPIRPSTGSGSDDGFVRDDEQGTTYIGEGCWGAPLRQHNRDKSWTRNSDAFNGFHWIWVDKNKMEVRTVKVDNVAKAQAIHPQNLFAVPQGVEIWTPSNGAVLNIKPSSGNALATNNNTTTPTTSADNELANLPTMNADASTEVIKFKYKLTQESDVNVKLYNLKFTEVFSNDFPKQKAGEYNYPLSVKKFPAGRYILIIKGANKPVMKYVLVKK
ncbi:MAG: hypothetical protein RLZZ292_3903, partial [Bacteroidota bacterium]